MDAMRGERMGAKQGGDAPAAAASQPLAAVCGGQAKLTLLQPAGDYFEGCLAQHGAAVGMEQARNCMLAAFGWQTHTY